MEKRKTHTIDADGQILGRLASQIALLLQGKNSPNYDPSQDMGDIVVIKNIEKIKVTGKKFDQKIYYHYSGYHGGLKRVPFSKLFEKRPSEVLRIAVLGMLPKNKLRAKRIKRLKFTK
ncbi:MAG: 50S ribosomal protein L13 [Candidatus Nealsonbacteria bacterium]|nr:50S ribosomal protein L13 [Candidatus Nealsonbacteria bacterium]